MNFEECLYVYKGKVVKVVDGDTMDIEFDLGFNVKIKERVRIIGINTPEVYGKHASEIGKEFKKFAQSLLENQEVYVKTYKDRKGKYGRYLAEIYLDNINYIEYLKEFCMQIGYPFEEIIYSE